MGHEGSPAINAQMTAILGEATFFDASSSDPEAPKAAVRHWRDQTASAVNAEQWCATRPALAPHHRPQSLTMC